MVEQPHLTHEDDGSHIVWDVHSSRNNSPLRFLGWLLIIVGAGVVLYDVRRWSFLEPMQLLLPLFTMAVGALLLSSQRGASMVQRPLLRLWSGGEEVGPRLERYDGGDYREVSLPDLTHVVFGMIDYPWPGREGVAVEAFALYLAREDGTPVPVIDGTLDKLTSYNIGLLLSQVLGLPLIELGKGQE